MSNKQRGSCGRSRSPSTGSTDAWTTTDLLSASPKHSGDNERADGSPAALVKIPLQHERALVANPFRNSGLPIRRRNPEGDCYLTTLARLTENENVTAATGSIDSVFVTTRVHGKVLILQASIGEEAVEAVSLGNEKTLKASRQLSQVSHTQQLVRGDLHKDVSQEPSIGNKETGNWEEASLGGSQYFSDTLASPRAAPFFMNANGEITSLHESFEEECPSVDCYSDLFGRRRRAPIALPRCQSLEMFRSTSQWSGPVPVRASMIQENADELSVTLPEARRREYTSILDSNENSQYEDLVHQSSSLAAGHSFSSVRDTVEDHVGCTCLRESTPSTEKSLSLLDSDRTNTSAASILSEDSILQKTLKARYGSFESHFSVATGVCKPLNISVTQELKDMVEEVSKNPVVIMKWLNPL